MQACLTANLFDCEPSCSQMLKIDAERVTAFLVNRSNRAFRAIQLLSENQDIFFEIYDVKFYVLASF
jgi:hypothetical protein